MIKELSIEVHRTYNLGNYESAKVAMGLTISIEPEQEQNLEEVKQKGLDWLNSSIRKEFEKMYNKKQETNR